MPDETPVTCANAVCRKVIEIGDAVYFWGGRGYCQDCNAEKVREHDSMVSEERKRRRA